MKSALLSLHDKDKPGSEKFAQELVSRGYSIISSGGTADHLRKHGIVVKDVSEITGYKPVLKHRVVTLAPQIHGGLLATPDLYPELALLKWEKIDLLYVTFYPLGKELNRTGATFESCLEKTDIGGPTMIRSANKGGEVIVMTDCGQVEQVLGWMEAGEPDRKKFLFRLRARAELSVKHYIELSAEVYERFGLENGYEGEPGYPRYLLKVGDEYQFLPLGTAARAYDSGMIRVEFGSLVMERGGRLRLLTGEDRAAVSEAADEYSASK